MAAVVAPALVVVLVAAETVAAVVEEAEVCAGLSVSGFGIEVAVLGTGPVATPRRCSASLARHSVVFEELIPAPCRLGSRLAAAVAGAAVGLAGLVGPAAVPVAAVAVAFAASFEGSEAYRPDSSESPACLPPSCSSAQSSEGRPTRKRLDRKGYRGIVVEMPPLCALR
ncbi:hypothetical protein HG530_010416 [Fusarium avenaceum]|nr:hypothetical protein HG530_010416 [Fusarium avenaceum]